MKKSSKDTGMEALHKYHKEVSGDSRHNIRRCIHLIFGALELREAL